MGKKGILTVSFVQENEQAQRVHLFSDSRERQEGTAKQEEFSMFSPKGCI